MESLTRKTSRGVRGLLGGLPFRDGL